MKLLKPLQDAITAAEGDLVLLSEVMKIFSDLEKAFGNNLSASPVLRSEEKDVLAVISNRKKFVVKEVHLAANLLNPLYRGCHLTADETVSTKSPFSYLFDI